MIIGNREQLITFSYVNVFEPKASDLNPAKKYSCQLLIDKNDKQLVDTVKKGIEAAILKGIEKQMFTMAASKGQSFKRCLRDGDAFAAEVEDGSRDIYKGKYFINASAPENQPPAVVGRFGQVILDQADFYSGCKGIAEINFYPFKFSTGGIAAGLNALMKREDGNRLDGKPTASDVFKDLVDSADELI